MLHLSLASWLHTSKKTTRYLAFLLYYLVVTICKSVHNFSDKVENPFLLEGKYWSSEIYFKVLSSLFCQLLLINFNSDFFRMNFFNV